MHPTLLATTLRATAVLATFSFGLLAQTTIVVAPPKTIQSGIDVATNGDTVFVLPGVYNENIDFKGKDITVRAQTTGFTGATIRGTGAGSVVKIVSGETRNAVLEGFDITGGQTTSSTEYGGGVQVLGSTPIIRRCHIHDNVSLGSGGGIGGYTVKEVVPTSPLIEDCLIERNSGRVSFGGGGAIGFGDGRTNGPGGTTTVRRCILRNNVAAGRGGAIYGLYNNHFLVENCRIYANTVQSTTTAIDGGGGIYVCLNSNLTVTNSSICGNIAAAVCGLKVFNSTKVRMVNCSITGNTGGAIHAYNNTGVYNTPTSVDVTNCVAYMNGSGEFWTTMGGPSQPTINVTYSCLTTGTIASPGVTLGTGNIFGDPKFANSAHCNLHLLTGSPCIDKGDNSAVGLPATDMDGGTRPVNGTVDMGADEWDGASAVLYHDRGAISVANPGTIIIRLQTSAAYGGGVAALVPSLSGIAPGTDLFGKHLPLNLDAAAALLLLLPLDAQGAFSITFPITGVNASAIGTEVNFAAAVDSKGKIVAFSNDIGVEFVQ